MLAFPLAVRIMTERSFPFPLLGLVHIGNEIVQHRPIGADEALTVRVRAQDLEPHDRGTQFAMAAEARAGEELVWSRATSTCTRGDAAPRRRAPAAGRRARAGGARARPLARARRHRPPLRARLGRPQPDPPARLEREAVRHAAADRPRHVAQGALPGRARAELPDAFTVDVRFKLPLFLPAQVAFGMREAGGFEVRDAAAASRT